MIIRDLLDHAEKQALAAAHRAADLFDTDDEKNLFYVLLFGRILTKLAQDMNGTARKDLPSIDALFTATMVIALTLPGKDWVEVMKHFKPQEIVERGLQIRDGLNETARRLNVNDP